MAERTGTWIEQRGKWLPPLRCSDCGEEIRLVVHLGRGAPVVWDSPRCKNCAVKARGARLPAEADADAADEQGENKEACDA